MDLQLKIPLFTPSDSLSVLSFPEILKTACNTNGFRESSAAWLFPYLIQDPSKADCSHRVTANNRKQLARRENHNILQSSHLVKGNLYNSWNHRWSWRKISRLKTDSKDDGKTMVRYSKVLMEMTITFGCVHNKLGSKRFLELGLHLCIWNSFCTYWGLHLSGTLPDLAHHRT